MDTVGKIIVGLIGGTAIVCATILTAIGKGDPIAIGIISTLALQLVTYLTTQTINTRVNGHMTKLVDAAVATKKGEDPTS